MELPQTTGNYVHAAFLRLVSNIDPDLSEKLHAPGREKPFTLSPLVGDFQRNDGKLLLKKGDRGWIRITALEPALSQCLLEWDTQVVPIFFILDEALEVTDIFHEGHPWARVATFEELYQRTITAEQLRRRSLTFRFFSPTTFRANGVNVPFPLPKYVFYTLSQKWNTYAPIHLGEQIHTMIEQAVTLSHYQLQTQVLDFGRYRQIGFTGEATFLIHRTLDDIWARVIHLLADFAFFAGVGYKTTMGMGQARKLSP
jgi:CRISPR-associated endoribonuclease Cas6